MHEVYCSTLTHTQQCTASRVHRAAYMTFVLRWRGGRASREACMCVCWACSLLQKHLVLLRCRLCTRVQLYLQALQHDETLTDQLSYQLNKW